MDAHAFTTPVKTGLTEKMADILPGDLNGFHLYDSITTTIEPGMRVRRAAAGKKEMLCCFYDYHGKTCGRFGSSKSNRRSGAGRLG